MKLFLKIAKSALPYILIVFFIWLFFSKDSVLSINKNPQTEIQDCIINTFNSDTNTLTATLKGDTLVRNAIDNGVILTNVKGDIFGKDNKMTITSNSANLDGAGNIATFTGNVVCFDEKDTYLYTTELFVNIKKERVYTHQNITIDEPEQTITGKGLESNLKIKRARILSNVKIVTKDKKTPEEKKDGKNE